MRAARARELAIDTAEAHAISRALSTWADELAHVLAGLPPDRQVAAFRSQAAIRRTVSDLDERIARAVGQGTDLALSDTLAVWQDAQQRVAAMQGVPNALLGGVANPQLTIAQAFSRQYPTTWRTLVRGYADTAGTEVAGIVRNALLRGTSPDTLARALRPYVTGRDRQPGAIADEIGATPAETRGAAYSMEHNAARIAFSETHNARREAEVAHFQADPFIALSRWELSPNRGTQRLPDVCDALARLDWYGLGAGVFPLDRVPLSPHPWDRCEVMPITWTPELRKKLEEMGTIRLRLNPADVPIPGAGLLSPRAVERIRLALVELLQREPVALGAGAQPAPPTKPEPAPTTRPVEQDPTPTPTPPAASTPAAEAIAALPHAEKVLAARAAPVTVPSYIAGPAPTLDATTVEGLSDQIVEEVDDSHVAEWTYDSPAPAKVNADAFHRRIGGTNTSEVVLSPEVTNGMREWAAGKRGAGPLNYTAATAHEVIHTTSAAVFGPDPAQYKRPSGFLTEEMVTERRARNFMARAWSDGQIADWRQLPYPVRHAMDVHGYTRFVQAADWLADEHGEEEVERLWRLDTGEKRRDYLSAQLLDDVAGDLQRMGAPASAMRGATASLGRRAWELVFIRGDSPELPLNILRAAPTWQDYMKRLAGFLSYKALP